MDEQLEKLAWIQFYANLCGMKKHPGNKLEALTDDELDWLAIEADHMLERYRRRICRSSAG